MAEFNSLIFRPWQDPVTLHEDENCEIEETAAARRLTLRTSWHASIARLARRFKVTQLAAELDGWDQPSLEFLDELPDLRTVFITAKQALDWKPLERHRKIEYASLRPELPWHRPNRVTQGELDFTRMAHIQVCDVPWIPEWDSIRRCTRLEGLEIHGTYERRELDLSQLSHLSELVIDFCDELRGVVLPEEAQLQLLRINAAPKLKIDLQRFVRDLEWLYLGGKIAFPLDDLGEAKKLRFLTLMFLKNRAPIPAFLHKLPALESVLAPSTRLSESDQAIEQKLNATRPKSEGKPRKRRNTRKPA